MTGAIAVLLGLCLGLTTAPPSVDKARVRAMLKQLPRLNTATPETVQARWNSVKALGSVGAQLRAIRTQRLEALACEGLADLRSLARPGGGLAGVGFRDQVRNRGFARPALARLLVEAYAQLRKERPGTTLTIGDVSQAGCGQLNHGVIVRELSGQEAEAWLGRADLYRGRPAVIELRPARDWPYEAERFEGPDTVVRLSGVGRGERRDKGKPLRLRIAETRHVASGPPDDALLAALADTFKDLVTTRNRVDVEEVRDARGKLVRWHFVDKRQKRQLELLATGGTRRLPKLTDTVEIRLGRWQDKKPGSFPGEILWIRRPSGWERWVQVNEAGHISHISGVDADLSYITRDNAAHFAVALEAMDVPGTWRWFEILDETARRLKIPLEAILIDKTVRAHLRANLPMRGKGSVAKHRLWSILKTSPGHDGHHHLRIGEVTSAVERAAIRALSAR